MLDETAEVSASDCVLDDVQVEDTVKGEGWEEGILSTPKLKLVAGNAFATLRPCVWPPQGQPVEVALVSEDEMFGAVMNADVPLVLFSILLVSLQSRP